MLYVEDAERVRLMGWLNMGADTLDCHAKGKALGRGVLAHCII